MAFLIPTSEKRDELPGGFFGGLSIFSRALPGGPIKVESGRHAPVLGPIGGQSGGRSRPIGSFHEPRTATNERRTPPGFTTESPRLSIEPPELSIAPKGLSIASLELSIETSAWSPVSVGLSIEPSER